MAGNSYIQALEQVKQLLDQQYGVWERTDRKILEVSKNIQKMGTFNSEGSLKELDSRTEKQTKARKELNKVVEEQGRLIKSLQKDIEKLNSTNSKTRKGLTEEERLNRKVEASRRAKSQAQSKENKEIQANRLAAQEANKEMKQAAKLSKTLADAYTKQTTKLNKLRAEYKNLAIRKEQGEKLTKKEIQRLNALQKEVRELDASLKKVDASAGQFNRSVGNYGKALGGLRDVVRSVTTAFGFMGGAFLAVSIFRDGVRRIREFDKEMQNMAGIMRTTRGELRDLEDEIISVSAASIKTSNEVAILATNLITLGKTKDEVKQLLAPVVDLGIGLRTTSENAGEFLVQTMNSFGAGTESAKSFAEEIATIRTSTSLNFQRMRDSFQYMSPIANALGHDLAWVGAIVGELSDNGLKAEQAGRVFSTAMQRLAKDGKSVTEALEELGEMQEQGATRQEAMAIATEMFGVQAAKTAVVLAGNTEEVERNAQAIRDSEGALDDLVNQQLESLDARLRLLDATYEKLLVSIDNGTKGMSRFVKTSIDGIGSVIKEITRLSYSVEDMSRLGANEGDKNFAQIIKKDVEELGFTAQRAAEVRLPGLLEVLAKYQKKAEEIKQKKNSLSTLMDPSGLYNQLLEDRLKTVTEITGEYERMVALASDMAGIPLGPKQQQEDYVNLLYVEQEQTEEAAKAGKTYADILEAISEEKKALKASTKEQAPAILENIAALEKEAEAWQRNNSSRKESKRIIDGSLAALNRQISTLEDERDRLATTASEREKYNNQIKTVEESIWKLLEAKKALKDQEEIFGGDFSSEGTAAGDFGSELDINGYQQHLRDAADAETQIETEKQEMLRAIREKGLGEYKLLTAEQIRIAKEAAKKEEDLRKDLESNIKDAVKAGASAIFETRIERIEEQIEANNEYYNNILSNEELTKERRDALEAERKQKEDKLRKEQRKEEKKQFLVSQGLALAEVAIATAKGVAEATAMGPATAGASLTWIPLILGTGAAQAATIIAQSIPKFKDGTENAPAGWAIVDEVRPEVHTDKHGNVKSFGSDKGSNMRFLEQGDKIYKSHKDYVDGVGEEEIKDTVWNLNMQYQGRSVAKNDSNLALLSEISMLRNENSKVWKEVKKLASRPINNNLTVEMPDNRPY